MTADRRSQLLITSQLTLYQYMGLYSLCINIWASTYSVLICGPQFTLHQSMGFNWLCNNLWASTYSVTIYGPLEPALSVVSLVYHSQGPSLSCLAHIPLLPARCFITGKTGNEQSPRHFIHVNIFILNCSRFLFAELLSFKWHWSFPCNILITYGKAIVDVVVESCCVFVVYSKREISRSITTI